MSVLARSVLGSSSRLNADKVRENFVLAHRFRQITRDFKDEWNISTRRHQLRIDASGMEVQKLSDHFLKVIEAMQNGTWRHFGNNSVKLHMTSKTFAFSDDRGLKLKMEDVLDNYYDKMVKHLLSSNKSHLEFQGKFFTAK